MHMHIHASLIPSNRNQYICDKNMSTEWLKNSIRLNEAKQKVEAEASMEIVGTAKSGSISVAYTPSAFFGKFSLNHKIFQISGY